MTTVVNIEDYIKLYNKGLRLNQIKPLNNETYKVFSSSNVDIRILNRKETYSNSYAFERIKSFIRNNQYFYMIPVTTINETIVGFILRGVHKKDYSSVSRDFDNPLAQVPLMFGFNRAFKNLDKYDKSRPIIVCEGCKDCLTLKRFYPYVLSINTSSMGLNMTVLRNISNKFLLAYDNDRAGQEGMDKDSKELRKLGAFVERIKLNKEFKDCAEFIQDKEHLEELSKQLTKKVNILYNRI